MSAVGRCGDGAVGGFQVSFFKAKSLRMAAAGVQVT